MGKVNSNQSKGGRPPGSSWQKVYYETISQLDAAIADQSLSKERRSKLIEEKSRLLRAFSERQARRELHQRHRSKEARRAFHDLQSERYARMTPAQIVETVKSRTQWQPLNDHEAAAFFQLGWTLPRVEELRQKQLGGQQ